MSGSTADTTVADEPSVLDPEWISLPSASIHIPDADNATRRKRSLPSRLLQLLVLIGLALLLWSAATDEPTPTTPELAVDPRGALYLLPPDDSDFVQWHSGQIITVSQATAISVSVAEEDQPGQDGTIAQRAVRYVLADPWDTGGQTYTYNAIAPSQAVRVTYNTYTLANGEEFHVLTSASTDAEAAITPLESDRSADRIDLRGVRGWVHEAQIGADIRTAISWQVTPNHIAKVVSLAPREDVLAVAESLRRASLNEWITDRAFLEDHYNGQVALWTCLTEQGVQLSPPPDFDEYVSREPTSRAWRIFDGASRDETFWDAMRVCP